MHMAARSYANEIDVNETGQIFRRKFEFDYFLKITLCFKRNSEEPCI